MGQGCGPQWSNWAHCSVRQGQSWDRADWGTPGVSSWEEKVQQRVEHYCGITGSSFLQHIVQNGTRKMLQLWYCVSSLVGGSWRGISQLSLHKDIPVTNLQWAQSFQVSRLSGTVTHKSQTEGFFTKACEGISCTPSFFSLQLLWPPPPTSTPWAQVLKPFELF